MTLSSYFGDFGGFYVPEILVEAFKQVEMEYLRLRDDSEFNRRLDELRSRYIGRPTPLYFAERLTREIGGAKIYLKREDLAHTGSHKINNAVGQALLAQSMGLSEKETT